MTGFCNVSLPSCTDKFMAAPPVGGAGNQTNIQHSTSNIQHRMNRASPVGSEFDVGCWMLDVSPHKRPRAYWKWEIGNSFGLLPHNLLRIEHRARSEERRVGEEC